jgi:hypothetical protein
MKKRLGLLKSNGLVVSLTENRLHLELDLCKLTYRNAYGPPIKC